MTYMDNCLTWLIVKPILSVNTGGSALQSCPLLSMALMACSSNQNEVSEQYQINQAIFALFKWIVWIWAQVIMTVSPFFPLQLIAALNGCVSNPSHALLTEWCSHTSSILISFVFYNLHSYMSGHQPVCPLPYCFTEMIPTHCGAR